MDKKFERTLIGYNKKDVEKKIDLINKEFEEIYSEYSKQLSSLTSENENLKKQVQMFTSQVLEYRNLKEELVNILYNTHIDAYTPIYDVLNEIEQKEKYKMDILQSQKKKYADIRESIDRFLSQIQNITTNNK